MISSILDFALKKPILNHLLLFFLFVLAVFSYIKIPKEIFPPSSMNSVSIIGFYEGASSDLLDKIIVKDLEDELSSIEKAADITSVIKNGFFKIFVKLKNGYDASSILEDVKQKVSQSKSNLPSDMEEPIVKEVINSIPLLTVVLYADISQEELLDIAKDVKSSIVQLKDLSNVSIWGDSKKQLLIKFDESKIKAYDLDLNSVISAVSSISSIFPAGVVKDLSKHYYLSTFNGEKKIADINNIILKISNKKVYLKDIASIEYKLEDLVTLSRFNGNRDISIGINKGEKGDSVLLVKRIKDILKVYEIKYPNITFATHTDTSVWIKNRLNTVVSNILFGLLLLFIALLFFINLRIAIVIAIGIPTSFMIALVFTQYLGYSLNMLSLLGALIALGMLVDEAIVVGENIYRHLEMGKNKFDACKDGAIEMFPAVLTATATTIFAFLPILMMTGEVGKFMKILPIMITILLLSSLLEAFFFLPLHAKEIFKVHSHPKKSDKIWSLSKNFYKKLLNYMLKKRFLSLGLMIFCIVSITSILALNAKFTFMEEFDTTQVYISGSVGVGKSMEQTEKIVQKIEDIVLKKYKNDKDFDSISSLIGLKLDGQNHAIFEEFYFHIFINLKERAPQNIFDKFINPILSPKYDASNMIREKSAQEFESLLKKDLKVLLNSSFFDDIKVFVPKAGIVKNDIELAIQGEQKEVKEAIKIIKAKLFTIKGVSNIADDISAGNLELKFKINAYGQSLGLSEKDIITALRPMYSKAAYAKMFDETGIVEIVFQSKNKNILKSLDYFEINIPGSAKTVLLKDLVSIISQNAYSVIFKENSKRIVSITASISKTTSSEVFESLNPILKTLSKNVFVKIKGEQEENEKFIKEMLEAALIAVILIFMALVWMFNSLIKPLIIVSTVPLSVLGVLAGHFILGMNLSMSSLIGMVGLTGVIVNDGIIMMDFIKKSKTLEELEEFALMRLRPILLTSLTTILGLSTLIFFASGQALILQPMAVSLGFGILWATVLNLYYVPMLYRLIYLIKL